MAVTRAPTKLNESGWVKRRNDKCLCVDTAEELVMDTTFMVLVSWATGLPEQYQRVQRDVGHGG